MVITNWWGVFFSFGLPLLLIAWAAAKEIKNTRTKRDKRRKLKIEGTALLAES
jgi:hypothetical protein